MSNIRNTISLVDRVSPTLRSIMKAMDSTLKAMQRLDRQSNRGVQSRAYQRAEADIRRANNAIIMMTNQSARAASGAHNVANAWSNVDNQIQKSKFSFSNMFKTAASGIYTIQAIGRAISKVTGIADSAISDVSKLSVFNTSGQSDMAVYGQVYKTAQESRSDLSATSNLAQRIMLSGVYQGQGATKSAIDLAGTINKAMVVGGGTSEENKRAIIQLSQALSSGVMQGDELRSIREQSPYLAKTIAEGLANVDDKFIGTTIGDLKELGAQGELTSKVVIQALESMSGQIEETFDDKAPKTFSGAMTSLGNTVQFFVAILNSADGPLGRINKALWDLADWLSTPQGFEALSSMLPILNMVAFAFQGLSWAIQFVGNNMSWIAPIFGTILGLIAAYNTCLLVSKAITWATGIATGVAAVASYIKASADHKAATAAAAAGSSAAAAATAFTAEAMAASAATAAQHGLNAAVLASPITWIIMAIIVLIGLVFLVVGIINKVTGSSISAIGVIVGALTTAVAFVWNLFLGILDLVLGVFSGIWNFIADFVNFFGNVFRDPIASIIRLFGGLADTVLGVLETIASALDKVFGSDMAGTVAGWRAGLDVKIEAAANKYGNGKYEEVMEHINLTSEDLGLSRWAYGDAWDTGYNFGAGIEESFSGFNMDDLMGGIEDGLPVEVAGGHLDSVDGDVDISDEDLKLLRDMAARDYLLQMQAITPVAHVTFGDVRETADVSKIVEVIEQMVDEQMATALVN